MQFNKEATIERESREMTWQSHRIRNWRQIGSNVQSLRVSSHKLQIRIFVNVIV
jgi:hypothetical protein